jgi:hypothetical protein
MDVALLDQIWHSTQSPFAIGPASLLGPNQAARLRCYSVPEPWRRIARWRSHCDRFVSSAWRQDLASCLSALSTCYT